MRVRVIRCILCYIGLGVVLLYGIQLIISLVRFDDISRAWYLSAIFLITEGAPISELVLPIIHMLLFTAAALLMVFNVSALKPRG